MSEPPELPGVQHEYLDIDGVRMHVALAGPADGEPVLLVHGWPQHWWCWRRVIEGLASDRFRLIVPDLPGHGWSSPSPNGYEKERLASDVLTLLDSLGIARVAWVGHDWGGHCGFLAALGSPERIARMLALGIPHPWVRRDPRMFAVMASYQAPISLPVVGPLVADQMVRRVLQVGRGRDRLSAEDLELFASHVPARTTVAMYRTFLTRELLPIARGRYARRRLELPTTLLAGERDAVTMSVEPGPVNGQPHLDVEVIPGVAHWIPEQCPERIISWIRAGRH